MWYFVELSGCGWSAGLDEKPMNLRLALWRYVTLYAADLLIGFDALSCLRVPFVFHI